MTGAEWGKKRGVVEISLSELIVRALANRDYLGDWFWIVQNSCQSLALEFFVSATHVQIERFKKSYSWLKAYISLIRSSSSIQWRSLIFDKCSFRKVIMEIELEILLRSTASKTDSTNYG